MKKETSESIKRATKALKQRPANDEFADVVKGVSVTVARGTKRIPQARYIPIEKIKPDPNQPRREFPEEEVKETADTIQQVGLLQYPTVEYIEKGDYYKIISGEIRYRALKELLYKEIPCIVQENVDKKQRKAKQLVENVRRKSLSPIEIARGLVEIKDLLSDKKEKKATWEEVSKFTGLHLQTIKQFIRLLNLPKNIQKEIVSMGRKASHGQITEKHCRALLKLNEKPEKQMSLFDLIKKEKLAGDEAIRKADELLGKKKEYIFTVRYKTEKELLEKLKEKIKELQQEG